MIDIKGLTKVFKDGDYNKVALDDINLKINDGEMVSIMGPSGSGKSTLLNIIACFDDVSKGEVYINDNNITSLKKRKKEKFRRDNISFIFQDYALLENFTCYENVELPLLINKVRSRKTKTLSLLEKMNLLEEKNKKINKLSGGQRQRVAIARALALDTNLILADEPTGALDQKMGEEVTDILRGINKEGKTVIIVTHDEKVANKTDRIIKLMDGKIIDDIKNV
ncbi:ABC transporter ATP-binding protein [Lachnospira pectinoschiza]|uniref:Putative ABC transport system ATP-binding protein n=1 Tax=Lachnospira pectinoschiza TaxID=28052 RepID=A0A1G9Z546_9FIRM|nr:ABC transporter ATP-binding protein [Lachnospira pectinoschiza]SDN16492.1 putative ABC transport system ATP-binding protein [Lachnospira pectinoschiza]